MPPAKTVTKTTRNSTIADKPRNALRG